MAKAASTATWVASTSSPVAAMADDTTASAAAAWPAPRPGTGPVTGQASDAAWATEATAEETAGPVAPPTSTARLKTKAAAIPAAATTTTFTPPAVVCDEHGVHERRARARCRGARRRQHRGRLVSRGTARIEIRRWKRPLLRRGRPLQRRTGPGRCPGTPSAGAKGVRALPSPQGSRGVRPIGSPPRSSTSRRRRGGRAPGANGRAPVRADRARARPGARRPS